MPQKKSEGETVMQGAQNRTFEASLLFSPPKNTPWGEVQHCDMLCTGVFMVTTAGHGGTMVSKDVAAILSPAARKCGFNHRGYICFEEDTQEDVVFRELLDKKLWTMQKTRNFSKKV